jgi:iron complex outermembrane receptor protein
MLCCFLIHVFFSVVGLSSVSVFAQEVNQETGPVFVLDEIIVTSDRYGERIRKIPANVTVITSEDIEGSTADSVTDILSSEGGLVKRGFLGNDKKTNVDIRGMGETSVSNVLVMVDGVRINPPDMAGPDFSSLALDQVQRIEIIRGAGSVLYGDSAVGGVINIITKPARGKPEARIKGEIGSYDTREGTATARGSLKDFYFSVVGSYSDSEGYRENGDLRSKNFHGNFFYDLSERLSLLGKIRLHKDWYGFPGPLTEEQFKEDPEQSTDTTGSDGETWEETYSTGLDLDLESLGNFTADYAYRERENAWILTLTPGRIEERTHDVYLKHKWDRTFADHLNELIVGVDYRHTEYDQTTSFATKPFEVAHWGYYFLNKLILADTWVLQVGGRHHDYESVIATTDAKTRWDEDVYTAGVMYLFDVGDVLDGSLFVNRETSFRVPDIDELGFATDDIRPQKGEHWDVGAKLLWGGRAELLLTWFYIRNEDEIWFDALNYINTNYELPTKRKGFETAVRVYPWESLKLWGSHTYIDAKFEGVDYEVPTVPEHKFAAGMNWRIWDWLRLGITYNYVGSRPQGGNPLEDYRRTGSTSGGGRYEDMPSYEVVDAKLTFTQNKTGLTAFVGVNNLFDEQYYTNNYYDNVYPAPGRNYRAGVEWAF